MNLPKTKKTLKALEKQIRQIPSFILVLNDGIYNIDDLDGIQFEPEAPWVLAKEGDRILTLFGQTPLLLGGWFGRTVIYQTGENLNQFALITRNI